MVYLLCIMCIMYVDIYQEGMELVAKMDPQSKLE